MAAPLPTSKKEDPVAPHPGLPALGVPASLPGAQETGLEDHPLVALGALLVAREDLGALHMDLLAIWVSI